MRRKQEDDECLRVLSKVAYIVGFPDEDMPFDMVPPDELALAGLRNLSLPMLLDKVQLEGGASWHRFAIDTVNSCFILVVCHAGGAPAAHHGRPRVRRARTDQQAAQRPCDDHG